MLDCRLLRSPRLMRGCTSYAAQHSCKPEQVEWMHHIPIHQRAQTHQIENGRLPDERTAGIARHFKFQAQNARV